MLRQVGVPTSSLLFANPCKMPGHIRHAAETGVDLTTFDSEGELHKLKELHPQTRVLLRIRADDPEAQCPLGVKYGAFVEDVPQLLQTARALGIQVAGKWLRLSFWRVKERPLQASVKTVILVEAIRVRGRGCLYSLSSLSCLNERSLHLQRTKARRSGSFLIPLKAFLLGMPSLKSIL